MKKQTWMTLALAAAIAVPAAAQQTSNDQNSQPAANAPQATQQQENAAASANANTDSSLQARQPLQQPAHEGFWGHLNPFARKKYVERQMSPIRNRVNELDELSAKNAKDITDVDQRAQEGIRMADAKATQADQHAVDAGNRAQMAHQTATQASTRLNTVEQVVGNIDQYKPVTEAEIHFRPGQAVLSAKAKEALDQMAQGLKDQRGYVIQVQGFSSGRGQTALENSQRMADSVVRYLVLNHEVPVYRIYTLGLGNAPVQASAQTGKTAKRTTGGRVEVSLLKNDVDQLSAQNTAAPSATGQGGMTGTSMAAPQTNAPAQTQSAPQAPASNAGQQPPQQ